MILDAFNDDGASLFALRGRAFTEERARGVCRKGYGPTIKALVEEKFGAGIMSAIDFTMDIDKVPDPKGDRVKITMNGKFLVYKKW